MVELPNVGDRVRLKAKPSLVGTVESFDCDEGRMMCFVKWDDDPNREFEDYLDPYLKLELISGQTQE